MSIFVNRTLNMKQIKAIGFDMDHTLVRYDHEAFEEVTYQLIKDKLIKHRSYPDAINKLEFDGSRAIRGLVIDKGNGNIIKLNLYGGIKSSYHGTRSLSFRKQQKLYRGQYIDLSDPQYSSVDTGFSIAYAIIYGQLVDLKDNNPNLEFPSYQEIEEDVLWAQDLSHRDGTLKGIVKENLKKFIIDDPGVVQVLERFKLYGKKLWVITNSDYHYTKLLLDHTINPHLKNHKHWSELFEITITSSAKPRFFTDNLRFLKIDPKTALLDNFDAKLEPGIYQGGSAQKIQDDFELESSEILYMGDHIYGDILRLKKAIGWRTGLVIEELTDELKSGAKTKPLDEKIEELMNRKILIEKEIDSLYIQEYEKGHKVDKDTLHDKFASIDQLDKELSKNIKMYQDEFNLHWGEVMRAGAEPSYYANQIERYADLYMSKVSDFMSDSPRTYYRPNKKRLAHDQY